MCLGNSNERNVAWMAIHASRRSRDTFAHARKILA
jgi:hypothetical protein